MVKEYSKEELWRVYEKIPSELKEAIFSEETARVIFRTCTRNGISDEKISEVARYVGRVLLGLLSPEKLPEELEKKLKLEKEVAKRVAQEIDRFVFYPLKASLEELYKVEIAPPLKPKVTPPPIRPKTLPEEKPTPPKRDIYREPIE